MLKHVMKVWRKQGVRPVKDAKAAHIYLAVTGENICDCGQLSIPMREHSERTRMLRKIWIIEIQLNRK